MKEENKKVVIIIIITILIVVGFIAGITVGLNKKNTETVNNSTSPYISSNENNLNTSNIQENDSQNQTANLNQRTENVTIEVDEDTITSENVSIIITDNNVNQYGWGIEFKIQEKVNGEWKYLNYISDDLSWIDVAYELNEDNQLTQKIDIEKYYGKLSDGQYRIVKPVYDNEEDGYVYIYSNEFEIK